MLLDNQSYDEVLTRAPRESGLTSLEQLVRMIFSMIGNGLTSRRGTMPDVGLISTGTYSRPRKTGTTLTAVLQLCTQSGKGISSPDPREGVGFVSSHDVGHWTPEYENWISENQAERPDT